MPRLAIAIPVALAALCPLLVTACSDEPDPALDDAAGSAPGEVLEGTISDEMIPYDVLRSQPPLAEIEPGDDAEGADAGANAGAVASGDGAGRPAGSAPADAGTNASAEDPQETPAED